MVKNLSLSSTLAPNVILFNARKSFALSGLQAVTGKSPESFRYTGAQDASAVLAVTSAPSLRKSLRDRVMVIR